MHLRNFLVFSETLLDNSSSFKITKKNNFASVFLITGEQSNVSFKYTKLILFDY